MNPLRHTARLAKGCIVTFEAKGGGMNIEWDQPPRRLTGRLRRRYEAERAVFIEMLATARGERIAVIDTDNLGRVLVYGPATIH